MYTGMSGNLGNLAAIIFASKIIDRTPVIITALTSHVLPNTTEDLLIF
jgi:hypothetical protein